MHQRDTVGRLGAQAAAEHRERPGFRIRSWNDRCVAGELDLVAADWRVGAVFWVKTRRLMLSHGLAFDGRGVGIAEALSSWSGDFTVEHLRGVG
jgi:hypothetical protein